MAKSPEPKNKFQVKLFDGTIEEVEAHFFDVDSDRLKLKVKDPQGYPSHSIAVYDKGTWLSVKQIS